jgi:hypothetical protein
MASSVSMVPAKPPDPPSARNDPAQRGLGRVLAMPVDGVAVPEQVGHMVEFPSAYPSCLCLAPRDRSSSA